jgi:hypothetical protein
MGVCYTLGRTKGRSKKEEGRSGNEVIEMDWSVVKGKYSGGVVELLEEAPALDDVEVIVLFPERPLPDKSAGIWEALKQHIVAEQPDLLYMTDEARRHEFEQLSAKIAERMVYESVEEFERAMRGDDYGIVRH